MAKPTTPAKPPAKGGAPISLTAPAYRLAMALYAVGAHGQPEDVPPGEDRAPLQELFRKEVAQNVGGSRGKKGKVKMLVPQDRLVLSSRGGTRTEKAGAGRGGRQLVELPYVEDLNVLLARIQEEETELNEKMGKAVNSEISRLTKELNSYEAGSQDYMRVFSALQVQIQKKQSLSSDIRKQAFANIRGDEKWATGRFLRLIRDERPPQ